MLCNVLSLQICVGKKASLDGFEAGVWCREEDSSNINNIARVDLTDSGSIAKNGERPGNLTDGDLLCQLLNFDLLERKELGTSGGRSELTLGLVLLAVLGRAGCQGAELLVKHRLKDFIATTVARVCVNLHNGLHIGYSGGDGSDRDEVTKVLSTNMSHCQGLGGVVCRPGSRLEDESVPACELSREWFELGGRIALLSLLPHAVHFLTAGIEYVDHIVLEPGSLIVSHPPERKAKGRDEMTKGRLTSHLSLAQA